MRPSQLYLLSFLITGLSSIFGQGIIMNHNSDKDALETRPKEHGLERETFSPVPPIALIGPGNTQTFFGAADIVREEDDEPVYVKHDYIPLPVTSEPRDIPTTLYARLMKSVQCTLESFFKSTWPRLRSQTPNDTVFYLDQPQHERGKALPREVLGWSRGAALPRPRRRYPASPRIKSIGTTERQVISPFLAMQPPREAVLREGLARHRNTTRKRIGFNRKMRKIVHRQA